MTYGDVAGPLTYAMTELLTHGKPYAELGGKHATRYEPKPGFQERAERVLRYRAMVLEYARDLGTALTLARTGTDLVARWKGWLDRSTPDRATLPGGRVANADELSNQHPNLLVDLWRQAAVVTVVAREREWRPLLDTINHGQELVVLKDIGDLMRALFRLDDRYHRLPGWQPLAGTKGGRLDRNLPADRAVKNGGTAVIRKFVEWIEPQLTPQGYTVDRIGYEPARPAHPAGVEIGEAIGALERLADVLAEETLRASSMRVLVRAQKGVSVQAARLAGFVGDVSAEAGFKVRGKVYSDLVTATRDVHGVVGDGVYAVSYSTVAIDALTRARGVDEAGVRRLAGVLDGVDVAVHASLTAGARRGDYFLRGEDRLIRRAGGLYVSKASFVPMTERNAIGFHAVLPTLLPGKRPQLAAAESVARRSAFGDMLSKSGLEIINGEHPERRARLRLEEQRARAALATGR